MWEEEASWSKGASLISGINGECDPISPLSSTGNGSPYSSGGGSMSPDTTSISSSPSGSGGGGGGGSIWSGSEDGDCFSPADLFSPTKGFFFGCGGGGWSFSTVASPPGGGGTLPSLHEWRKFDLQRKYLQQQQQHQHSLLQRFIFPEVNPLISGEVGGATQQKIPPNNGSSAPNDSVVTSSTPSSPLIFMNKTLNTGMGGNRQSSSKVLPPPLTIGQRAVKFMKSFQSSTSGKTLDSEVISSTCKAEVEKPFDCLWIDCRASFLQKVSLIEHIDRIHIQTRKEDFSCFWHGCVRRNRAFNARYKLLIHMRVHTGHKPNKCTVSGCDKAFSRLENLKIHLRSHTGERPYICPHCPKAFSNSSDRAKHQRTHFDSKPYACTYQNCEKRYTDPSSLRKHAKMHYFVGGAKGVKTNAGAVKKEGQQGRRNRRKYLGGGGGGGAGDRGNDELKPAITQASAPPPPVFQIKQESDHDVRSFLTGNDDPPLNQFVGASSSSSSQASLLTSSTREEGLYLQSSSPSSPPSPLLMQNDLISAAVGVPGSDLDGISLGELDWISGVNFDDNFDIDYFL